MSGDQKFNPAPVKPLISFDELARIDVRVGTILSLEGVAGSDKLLKLTVDFGDHRRSILAGMKKEREDPGKSKVARHYLSSTSNQRNLWAKFRKECCSTSGMRMA